jgi:formylmethanofuran dehydrogenase subunit C
MPLRLRYTARTTIPVEVEGLTPAAVRGRALAEIEKLPVFHGNRQVPLAELFAASGSADDLTLEFEGDVSGVHWIGAGMEKGTIHVRGSAGRHVGSGMRGGEIHVDGDAGDWLAAELRGGLIHVRGRAGHQAGAAYRGSRRGVTGGTILIHGGAGDELGLAMRRGLIAVGGDCGDAPARNMLAGTVLVLAGCGRWPAANMRRGTLALLGGEPVELLPTFRRACRLRPAMLPLLLAELRRHGFPCDERLASAECTHYCGDLVDLGRGEVLTLHDAA